MQVYQGAQTGRRCRAYNLYPYKAKMALVNYKSKLGFQIRTRLLFFFLAFSYYSYQTWFGVALGGVGAEATRRPRSDLLFSANLTLP